MSLKTSKKKNTFDHGEANSNAMGQGIARFGEGESCGYTVKKRLAAFPSPAAMSHIKLSLARNHLIIPGQGEFGK